MKPEDRAHEDELIAEAREEQKKINGGYAWGLIIPLLLKRLDEAKSAPNEV
jgi:hypothetical protein